MGVKVDQGAQIVANMNKDRRACRVAIALVLLVVMVSFNFDLTVKLQRIISSDFSEDSETPNGQNSSKGVRHGSSKLPHKVQQLVDKLRETSRLAADGHDYTLTAAEREAWHEQYPCRSRSELPAMYAARKHVRDIATNPMWDQVFDEYTNLHRICMKRVANISEHFLNKSNVTVPGCKFLLAEGTFGLGNKIVVTVSAMLYAIVSQRVLLVPSWMTFNRVLCEPFVGSSWLLDAETFPMPKVGLQNNTWEVGSVFVENLNHTLKALAKIEAPGTGNYSDEFQSGKSLPLVDALVVSALWQWQPWKPQKWFFCNTEQRFLSEVSWIYFSGCIYSIPDLFGSAPFGPTLQALFPDRIVITRLLRSTVLPSDSVWSRFKTLNDVYFQRVNRRVGIQLRFFDDRHESMSGVMNNRVLDCALTNGILPNLNESKSDRFSTPFLSAPITTVFIASLHSELHDHLSEFYLRSPTVTGEAVGVVQVTTRQAQSAGTEEDRQALVEMLLLSVSDSLLITPTSTFGGMGQAYGGLTPWFLRVNPGDGAPCERGQTIDLCEQNSILGYECPNDPPSSPQWQGVVGDCLKIDLGGRIASGIQILDHHLSLQQAQ